MTAASRSSSGLSVGLLVYTHVGYPVAARRCSRGCAAVAGAGVRARRPSDELPSVSVIVAAYAEQDVIAARVANLRALDYPPELLEVIVACDGSPDATAARAREAGADLVLELPRGGKIRAQDAAVERATRRDRGVLGRERALGAATRCRRWSRRSPIRASATCAATCGSSTSAARTRRASTGATRWRSARSSRACAR